MDKNQLAKKQRKKLIHLRIWISGFIASIIFIAIMYILGNDFLFLEAAIRFIVFLSVWVILHYLFLNKQFKSIDKS